MGWFYSSDLSADVELMAAEISRGNETIGTGARVKGWVGGWDRPGEEEGGQEMTL